MKKCCFIIPYFGRLPYNFQLFLNSCKYNDDFNWLIITDDKTQYSYPANIEVKYMEFSQLQQMIKNKFVFDVSIDTPYKLCDYKPAYGYIFEDYIKGFKFWGHCDCDLIFGKLNHFINDEMLKVYDKLFVLGHCTLYKNTHEVNRVFMNKYQNKERYKEVYSSKEIYTFDEEYLSANVNRIFKEYGYNVLEDDYSANLAAKYPDFRITRFDKTTRGYLSEGKNKNFFVWDNGVLKRYSVRFKDLIESEYMYIHFQSREMLNQLEDEYTDKYKIATNRFTKLEVEQITKESFNNVKAVYKNNHRRRIFTKNFAFWKKKILNKLFGK